MAAHAAWTPSSPVQVTLSDLVRLRPAGEALKLTAPRIRVANSIGRRKSSQTNTGRLRSSRNTFVCGLPVRAVTRQSIVRRSSPG